MSFHKRFASNVEAEQNGTWVDFGDGIGIKLRSPKSAHTQAARKDLEAEYAPLIKMGQQIPEKDQERLFTKLLSVSIIVDWKGVTLPTGEKDEKGDDVYADVPATPEGFLRVVDDPQYSDFRNDIVRTVTDRDTFRTLVRELDAKN